MYFSQSRKDIKGEYAFTKYCNRDATIETDKLFHEISTGNYTFIPLDDSTELKIGIGALNKYIIILKKK
jgi:hypothetical protein